MRHGTVTDVAFFKKLLCSALYYIFLLYEDLVEQAGRRVHVPITASAWGVFIALRHPGTVIICLCMCIYVRVSACGHGYLFPVSISLCVCVPAQGSEGLPCKWKRGACRVWVLWKPFCLKSSECLPSASWKAKEAIFKTWSWYLYSGATGGACFQFTFPQNVLKVHLGRQMPLVVCWTAGGCYTVALTVLSGPSSVIKCYFGFSFTKAKTMNDKERGSVSPVRMNHMTPAIAKTPQHILLSYIFD